MFADLRIMICNGRGPVATWLTRGSLTDMSVLSFLWNTHDYHLIMIYFTIGSIFLLFCTENQLTPYSDWVLEVLHVPNVLLYYCVVYVESFRKDQEEWVWAHSLGFEFISIPVQVYSGVVIGPWVPQPRSWLCFSASTSVPGLISCMSQCHSEYRITVKYLI